MPGLLFCISVLYAFLAEVVFFRVGAESPRATALFVLAVLLEYEFGVVLQGLLPQTLPASYWLHYLISALAPFLWVPFGRAEPRS